jgi:hypothetical protein
MPRGVRDYQWPNLNHQSSKQNFLIPDSWFLIPFGRFFESPQSNQRKSGISVSSVCYKTRKKEKGKRKK